MGIRRFLTPYILIGLIVIIVAIISWQTIPAWKNAPGGFLTMLAVVIIAILAIAKDVTSIAKDWKEITKKEDDKNDKSGFGSEWIRLETRDGVTQTGETNVVASQIKADQIGGSRLNIERVDHLVLPGERDLGSFVQKPPSYPPLQLPDPPLRFRDRKRELTHLLSNLQPGSIYTLCAPGGTGKTDLVSYALRSLTDGVTPPAEFPDGVIFHTFYKQRSLDLALDHIACAYGEEVKPTPLEAARRALSGRQALLVLDGAEDAENLDAILGIRNRCCVIITSRDRAHLVDCGKELHPLKEIEGLALLADWGKEYAREPEAVRRVWELVGGLSLALRIAGQYMSSTQTHAQEYARLLEATLLSEILQMEERRLQSIPVLLGQSLAQVNKDARSVFSVTSLLAFSPFPRQLISIALDFDESRAALALGELVRFGLLQRSGDSYQLTHALLYTYARQEIDPPPSALEKLSSFFTIFTDQESEKGLEGYAELDKVRSHVLFLLEQLEKTQKWENLLALAWAIEDYLDLMGYSIERLLVCQRAFLAARESNDIDNECSWLGNLGIAYDDLGESQKAMDFYEQALEIARKIGDLAGEGSWLGNLGLSYANLGKTHKAIEYIKQALEISRQIGDLAGEGSDFGNIGLVYNNIGKSQKAIEYHKQALEISRRIGDRRNEGYQLGNLGLAYGSLGDSQKAIEYHKQALEISRRIGDRRNEGYQLGNLGLAYGFLGDSQKAIDYLQQGLKISRQIDDLRGVGFSLSNLGLAYATLDESHKAIEYYQQALEIFHKIGDRQGEDTSLGNLGLTYVDLGESQKAIDYLHQALEIARQIGDRQGEDSWLGSLGLAYADLGESRKAIEYYQQALDIARQIGDRRNEGNHLGNLGSAYTVLGEMQKAIEYHKQALDISCQIADRRGEGADLNNLGLAYTYSGESQKAMEYHKQALKIDRQIGNRHGEGVSLCNLGLIYADLGESQKAIEFFNQALEITHQIGDRLNKGNCLGNLGNAYFSLGEPRKAIDFHQQALEIARQIGDRYRESIDLNNLGDVYKKMGDIQKARSYYEQSLDLKEQILPPDHSSIQLTRRSLERLDTQSL